MILDSGAVIALARNDARARAVLHRARDRQVAIWIPAVVIAETVRGGAADAPTNRVVRAIGEVIPVDEAVARAAGALLGTTGSSATVDALVVASAAAIGGGIVLTGDPDDLETLADGYPEVLIEAL